MATYYLTRRIYYDNPYLRTFRAKVLQWDEIEGHPALLLDRTAFYPGGGGQPPDTGTINGISVVGMKVDERGGVWHLLKRPVRTREVIGRVEWDRRFDHMQQHTGQHILSAAFAQMLDAQTVGFHMGAEETTIDLDKPNLSPTGIASAEWLANRIVLDNRKVEARFVDEGELSLLPLRKQPSVRGPVRIVEIAGFDLTPCGGTHVMHTGEVGPIKITKLDRRGDKLRVSFLCGWRALKDYSKSREILDEIGKHLTTGYGQILPTIKKLQERLKEEQKLREKAEESLAEAKAASLAEKAGGSKVKVVRFVASDRREAQLLSNHLTKFPNVIALIGWSERGKPQFLLARGKEPAVDMNSIVRQTVERFGGRGGGRPEKAQCGLPEGADMDRAMEFMHEKLLAEVEK